MDSANAAVVSMVHGPKKDLESANLPPDFVPFQQVKLVKTPPAGERWMHEIKFDGYRLRGS
jgi:ATP-dependent DNA ligase